MKTLLRSFAGGEITPEMYARLDLAKNQTGLAKCLNFEIRPHGPAVNRAGTEYVLHTKDSSKVSWLLPFIYSTTQAYILEFGDQYVRFHALGATILESNLVITNVTRASTGVVTYTGTDPVNGEWHYLSGIVGTTELNGRYVKVSAVNAGANTFQLTDLNDTAIDTTDYTEYISGGAASRVYEIVSPYLEADLDALVITQSSDVLTITHQGYAPRELRRSGATSWAFSVITSTPVQVAPTAVSVAATAASGTSRNRYRVTALAEADREESLASITASSESVAVTAITQATPGVVTAAGHGRSVDDIVYVSGIVGMTELNGEEYRVASAPTADTLTLKDMSGTAIDTTTFTTYTSGGTIAFVEVINDLSVAGAKNTITWTDAAGAIRYNVYKHQNGLFGYIGQSGDGVSGFIDNNVMPDMAQTPPETNDPIGAVDDYPGACGSYQSREWFAGSINKPQNVAATRSGTRTNFTYSIPTRDSDAITARLVSRQANTIRHLVELNDLLALTSGAEWLINAGGAAGAITPGNIDYRVQGGTGASKVRPVITDSSVLYAADKGGHIREIKFAWESQSYESNDLSLLATHLFDEYTITSQAYVRGPYPTLWCTRSDGLLLGLTYIPKQQVFAWHQHDTLDGEFECVAAIPEGRDDVLYAIVKRTMADGSEKRFIERKHSRAFATLADAFVVDCGLVYSGAAVSTVSGLWHLAGETVSILADGAVMPQQVVTAAGKITLEAASTIPVPITASKIAIGKAITADLETLPMAMEIAAFGQGTNRNVSKVHIRVRDSSSVFAGPSFDKLTENKIRTDEAYGSPPVLRNEQIRLTIKPSWNLDAPICIRQTKPLPLSVLALVPDTAVGG